MIDKLDKAIQDLENKLAQSKLDFSLTCDYCKRKMFTFEYLEDKNNLYIVQLCKKHHSDFMIQYAKK